MTTGSSGVGVVADVIGGGVVGGNISGGGVVGGNISGGGVVGSVPTGTMVSVPISDIPVSWIVLSDGLTWSLM